MCLFGVNHGDDGSDKVAKTGAKLARIDALLALGAHLDLFHLQRAKDCDVVGAN